MLWMRYSVQRLARIAACKVAGRAGRILDLRHRCPSILVERLAGGGIPPKLSQQLSPEGRSPEPGHDSKRAIVIHRTSHTAPRSTLFDANHASDLARTPR